jgi:hypothetical protein
VRQRLFIGALVAALLALALLGFMLDAARGLRRRRVAAAGSSGSRAEPEPV